MFKKKYLQRLIDAAHVQLYFSANDGARIKWPWRMQPPKEASTTYREVCDVYVIDSDPEDDTVTNTDVLDTAHELGAEVACLADVYQDKNGTVERLMDGLETADDHPFNGVLLIPLQRPYTTCWKEIGEPNDHWIGLGGMKKATDKDRIRAAKGFRQEVGPSIHVHGFGWRPRNRLAKEIRTHPDLLDTLDYSTPSRDIPVYTLRGDEVMSVQAAYAGAMLIRDLRRVTPFVNDEDLPTSEQVTVETFEGKP